MQETRRMRLQAEIQRELSSYLLKSFKEHKRGFAMEQCWTTVTGVQMNSGGDQATVYVTFFSPEQFQETGFSEQVGQSLKKLNGAASFLRHHLGKVLKIRYTPSLIFKMDPGIANTVRVHTLLQGIAREEHQ